MRRVGKEMAAGFAAAVVGGSLLAASAAWAAPEDAAGVWRTEDGRAAVEIAPCGNSMCGKLIWYIPSREGPTAHQDANNPDEGKRTRPLCNLDLVGGFQRDENGWSGGWIYDAKSGTTYNAKMENENRDSLRLRGYVGVPLFGKTQLWTRAPANQERCS